MRTCELRHRAILIVPTSVVRTLLLSAGSAAATATDARDACGVTVEDPVTRTATVPDDLQFAYFQSVPSAVDPTQILCGNGVTTGAVHIEVAHDVPNWADGVTAIVNTIDHGKKNEQIDRVEYTWTIRPGKTMIAVVGQESLITAFPTDGLEETWLEASGAQ